MRYIKLGFLVLLVLFGAVFFHYTLPQRDIVRIVEVENRRIDFGENSLFWASADTGTETVANRDVRFINTIRANGKPMVYRNEDTGWGWPPYFKLDSSNLQTEASDLASSKDDPQWVVLKHYGWRSEFFSIFPNAVSAKAVDGPDVKFFPWLNIIIITLTVLGILSLWRFWVMFRKRKIDPVMEDAEAAWNAADDQVDATRGKISGWLGSWRSKPRKYK